MYENSEGFPCEVVAVDLGGTHARFAIAKIDKGKVLHIDKPLTLRCADYNSLAEAWRAFEQKAPHKIPRKASIAVACPLVGETLKMTNNPWVIRKGDIAKDLGLDDFLLVNDFAAVAHAVAYLEPEHFSYLCGPERDFLPHENISIVGPGTGLGVAALIHLHGGEYRVLETEAGHIAFAPLDDIEYQIFKFMKDSGLCRVSSERVVSGPGLLSIYKALAHLKGVKIAEAIDDRTLWQNALEGKDVLAREALDRFCLSLGSVAGDILLAHGSNALVIAGGVGLRIAKYLKESGFEERFQSKGRFREMMRSFPVKVVTYPEPGLFGSAAAYATKLAREN